MRTLSFASSFVAVSASGLDTASAIGSRSRVVFPFASSAFRLSRSSCGPRRRVSRMQRLSPSIIRTSWTSARAEAAWPIYRSRGGIGCSREPSPQRSIFIEGNTRLLPRPLERDALDVSARLVWRLTPDVGDDLPVSQGRNAERPRAEARLIRQEQSSAHPRRPFAGAGPPGGISRSSSGYFFVASFEKHRPRVVSRATPHQPTDQGGILSLCPASSNPLVPHHLGQSPPRRPPSGRSR